MRLENQNILFFLRANLHGGTENVVLQMCEILAPHVKKIVVASGEGISSKEFVQYGIKHYVIPDIEKKSVENIFGVSRQIKKIVKDEKITVIHTHHRMAAFYVTMLNLDKKSVFINTSHNTFYDKKILTKMAYKNCNLIACGEMVKKNLTDYYGIPDCQVTVIRNAVKPYMEGITEDKLIKEFHDEGYFVVGNIGRLSEQKGLKYFIQAIPDIINKYPKTRFVIAGNGEDEEALKKLSADVGVDECLTFLGYRRDVRNLMSQLDLIVLSSLWEGLPLTPIEAFSVGKTIVATSVDGTVEIVEDGENGILINKENSKLISEKVIWMIEHREEKKQMEIRAKKTYENSFCFDVLSKGILDYYRSL